MSARSWSGPRLRPMSSAPSRSVGPVVVHELSAQDARRIAVRAKLPRADCLNRPAGHGPPPDDAPARPDRGGCAERRSGRPGADGLGVRSTDLVAAVEKRNLIELDARLRSAEDFALYRAEMAQWPGAERPRDLASGEPAVARRQRRLPAGLLDRLPRRSAPSRELPDTCAVPGARAAGPTTRTSPELLDSLVPRGEGAVAGPRGRGPAVRPRVAAAIPTTVLPVRGGRSPPNERRRAGPGPGARTGVPGRAGGRRGGRRAGCDRGRTRRWRVDPAQLGLEPFAGRVALLSPFDRLVHDRKRAVADLRVRVPAGDVQAGRQRRWGYYALPILSGDELVGKLDATADRKTGVLRVDAIHQDVPFDAETDAGVRGEMEALAGWLGLEVALAAMRNSKVPLWRTTSSRTT